MQQIRLQNLREAKDGVVFLGRRKVQEGEDYEAADEAADEDYHTGTGMSERIF
jgi:hypothetical protein